MATLRAVLVIAGKDLRQRRRDRSVLVLGIVAPLAISLLMSFAFRGVEDFHFTLAVVDDDGGALAEALLDVLGTPDLVDVLTVEMAASAADATNAVDAGTVDAGLVIPAGFTSAAMSVDGGATLEVLASVDATLAAQVTDAIASGFLAQVNADRLSVATALLAGAPVADLESLVASASQLRLPEQVSTEPPGNVALDPVSYYAPGMGLFFVLFAIGFTARSYFGEVQLGTIDRIAAAPVGRGVAVVGKALAVFVYAIVSLGIVALVTGAAFGADWGHPVAVAVVIVAFAIAVVALTALVIGLARNERQAEGLASIVVFGLALLGGNFISLSTAPPVMRTLALATPNGWALRAFNDLATTGGGAAHDLRLIAGPVAGILASAALVATVAAVASRRSGTG